MEQVIELLKDKIYQIPQVLLFHYRMLGMTDQEFVVVLYLWNMQDSSYNPKKISNDLNLKLNEVLEIINTLSEKGFLQLSIVKINNVRSEVIRLDLLYEKLAFLIMKQEVKKEKTDVFDIFEKEMGRQLSPTEIGIIRGWLDTGCREELLLLALQEAVYNGITNLRYIDRIVSEWTKKGIKSKEDVERNRKEFRKKKENQELFDYDWLNDDTTDN